jgi:alpha-mannosidase
MSDNDCKYGYDAQSHAQSHGLHSTHLHSTHLRLTLLRSPQWPHPDCDRGLHRFTYALYPHGGNWQQAKTVQQGYALNQPLLVVFPESSQTPKRKDLPGTRLTTGQFLGLDSDNIILSACKRHQTNPDRWLLRLYEAHGEIANLKFSSALGLTLGSRLNLLEDLLEDSLENLREDLGEKAIADNPAIQPWQVATFEILDNRSKN